MVVFWVQFDRKFWRSLWGNAARSGSDACGHSPCLVVWRLQVVSPPFRLSRGGESPRCPLVFCRKVAFSVAPPGRSGLGFLTGEDAVRGAGFRRWQPASASGWDKFRGAGGLRGNGGDDAAWLRAVFRCAAIGPIC